MEKPTFEQSQFEQEQTSLEQYRNPKEVIADAERASDYRFETSLLNKDGFELDSFAPAASRL